VSKPARGSPRRAGTRRFEIRDCRDASLCGKLVRYAWLCRLATAQNFR
jgi:hypothetical protein